MPKDQVAEGGCGVIGMACSERIAGRHLLQSLTQMRNRGNGKGGGIAAVGLVADQFGVSPEVLQDDYLLTIAYLDEGVRSALEKEHIEPTFTVDHVHEATCIDDFQDLPGLEVRPPDVVHYFLRARSEVVDAFRTEHELQSLSQRQLEDELVYQNSVRLNRRFYASTGKKRAFVLSHGKNLIVMKMVGYGDDVIRYYQLEDLRAHVWIGHHRYPTKGRVWHPGGAHPFIGLNEALVHNGDFANYASIVEYLAQRNIRPLYLTDTEVSVQVFDLLHRTYGYPLEYVIEALAPTTERDFHQLPIDKQKVYRALQTTHMHCSPDGPWFFLVAQSDEFQDKPAYRLTGITDTSMLRPQVFAWQDGGEGGPSIGLAASEKQAIDAALASLSEADDRFWPRADRYWNARGGSHTDGGAFSFSVLPSEKGEARLVCTDKFGRMIVEPLPQLPYRSNGHTAQSLGLPDLDAGELYSWLVSSLPVWRYDEFLNVLAALKRPASVGDGRRNLQVLTWLLDRHYPTGGKRRSSLLALCDKSLWNLLQRLCALPDSEFVMISRESRPLADWQVQPTAVLDARDLPPEGPASLAREIVRLYESGCRHVLVARTRGQRFIASGLGGRAEMRIDVYGSPGDYLGSGIDGVQLHVHGSAQDQVAQIMKAGRLVIHGDVGQTFMYGAKGGEAYVLGNAAGRPLINAVGRPRVIINGTCLDYLA
ncbi:MAG: hypothetical protein R3300_18350, partial [Candidatus Promineifilaceae bacterium]|nr:hypothetical protein [Candidatus Promineifilaceae bacterium]